jgi:ABC-type sugar transport system substrate-binding protein
MKSRFVTTLPMILLAMLVVVGGFAASIGQTVAQDQEPTFGVVVNNADHPSITAMNQGMQDEAAIYGVKLVILDPAFDPQKQVSMIDNLIAQEVDALLVNAVDPAAVVPSLKKASEAGIPVIMNNADTNEEGHQYTETFVTTDTYGQGFAVGEAIKAVMEPNSKMAIISGKPGQSGVAERIQGAKDALEGTGIEFIGRDDLLGKVFGVNGNKEACDAIANGEMGGTALQLSYLVGVYSIRAAWDVTHDRIVDDIIAAPTVGLTKENLPEWESQCW